MADDFTDADRRDMELEAVRSMFAPEYAEDALSDSAVTAVPSSSSQGALDVRVLVSGCVLQVTMQEDYPSTSSLSESVALSGTWKGNRKARDDAIKELRQIAQDAKGAECLVDMCLRLQALIEDAAECHVAEDEVVATVADMWFSVIMLDHMNDRRRYVKQLQGFAGSLHALHVLMLSGGTSRPEGASKAFIVVVGEEPAVASFTKELRTQLIDVNKNGEPCRERMATVLCKRRRAKHGDDGQPIFGSVSCEVHGECVEMFDNNDELEKALDERNVLHCGSGDMRFEV
ncbi:RWD domain-containing protein 3 [Pseudoscourfieldia marina]